MAVTINGTTGITGDVTGNLTGNVTGDLIGIDDNATSTAITIDASQNVGIGVDNPTGRLHAASASGVGLSVTNIANKGRGLKVSIGDIAGGDLVSYNAPGSSAEQSWLTNNNERMRLDSSGTLLLRTTTAISNDYAINTFGGAGGILIKQSGSSIKALRFENYLGTEVGSITAGLYNAAYNTSSDYRLKENVADLTGAADRINQIPVRRFNFIVDPDTTIDGFLAHEVADVVPEAITGTKDAVDDEGNPVYQGIDQSKLVPLLTAALQEALTEITDLKARVSALETN